MLKITKDDNKIIWLINITMVIITLFAVGTTIAITILINAQNTINQCEKIED